MEIKIYMSSRGRDVLSIFDEAVSEQDVKLAPLSRRRPAQSIDEKSLFDLYRRFFFLLKFYTVCATQGLSL